MTSVIVRPLVASSSGRTLACRSVLRHEPPCPGRQATYLGSKGACVRKLALPSLVLFETPSSHPHPRIVRPPGHPTQGALASGYSFPHDLRSPSPAIKTVPIPGSDDRFFDRQA